MTHEEEISLLGHRAYQFAESMERQVARLHSTPITVAQYLLGDVCAALDFRTADTLVRELDAACGQYGDEVFAMRGDQHTLNGVRDYVSAALSRCEPFRVKAAS